MGTRMSWMIAAALMFAAAAPLAHAQIEEQSIARLWRAGDPGTRMQLRGRVVDAAGRPLAGASIRLWQADGSGDYHDDRYRAELVAGKRGEFAIESALPAQYYGAKHIHVLVKHDAHSPLHTRILFRGDPNIDAGEEDLAIALEEVKRADETVLVGNVELVMRGAPSN